MTDVIDWLRDCIEHDRTEAQAGISDNAPSEVLAQCEAHTKILDLYAAEVNDGDYGTLCGLGAAVDALGLAYQHRPGYRSEWRP